MKTNENKNETVKIEVVKIEASSIAQLTIKLLTTQTSPGMRMSNEEIMTKIKSVFPKAKDSINSIRWYSSKLNQPHFALKHGIENFVPLKTKKTMKTVEVSIETTK